MKRSARALPLAALLAAASPAVGTGADPPILVGRVLVLDGDTITVGGQRVRLWGIDAADLNQSCTPRKNLTCGEYARITLQQLATGRIARCEVKEASAFDVQVVARCEITEEGRTIDLSREMVRLGYAYADRDAGVREYTSQELRILPFKRPSEWRRLRAKAEAERH